MTTADLYRQLADSAERIADLEQQNLALLQQVREMESAKEIGRASCRERV